MEWWPGGEKGKWADYTVSESPTSHQRSHSIMERVMDLVVVKMIVILFFVMECNRLHYTARSFESVFCSTDILRLSKQFWTVTGQKSYLGAVDDDSLFWLNPSFEMANQIAVIIWIYIRDQVVCCAWASNLERLRGKREILKPLVTHTFGQFHEPKHQIGATRFVSSWGVNLGQGFPPKFHVMEWVCGFHSSS